MTDSADKETASAMLHSPVTSPLDIRRSRPSTVDRLRVPIVRSAVQRGGRRVRLLAGVGLTSVLATAQLSPSFAHAAPPVLEAPLESAAISGLSEGSVGPQVVSLQSALIEAGVSVRGGADGVFGPATRAAVVAFQEQRGLAATGTVDAATAETLATVPPDGAANLEVVGSKGNGGYVGLSVGAEGPDVEQLQQALIDIGVFVPGGADGIFGTATAKALGQFQHWNGLEVSGTVTEATVRLLDLAAVVGSDATAPSSDPTPAPQPVVDPAFVGLRLGASGPLVRELQQALMSAGVTVLGGADGAFGSATQGALKAFQWKNGRAQSGVVGEADAAALGLDGSGPVAVANPSTAPTSDTPDTPDTTSNPYVGLTTGDEGPLVTEVQKALEGFGFVIRGGANGVFGPSTKSTLMAFQSVNAIPKTGVVTEKGASIMKLGADDGRSNSDGGGNGDGDDGSDVDITLERFPVQGLCFFGDTWHAPRSNGRVHEGVDIIAQEGQLLYAVTDGEITKQYWDFPGALAGNGVRLTHDDGTYFTYLHMLDVAPGIEVGTEVQAGDVIGFVGNTGSSATAHLHFEMHPGGGAAINPYPYVKAIDDCKNTTPQYQQSFPAPAPAAVSDDDAASAEIGISG